MPGRQMKGSEGLVMRKLSWGSSEGSLEEVLFKLGGRIRPQRETEDEKVYSRRGD